MARRLSNFTDALIHGLNCCCCLSSSDSERNSIELDPVPPPPPEEERFAVAEGTVAVQIEAAETTERIEAEGSSSARTRPLIEDITPTAPQTTVQTINFSEFQERGARIRRWIEDPQEPNCHITKSTLTWQQIEEMGYSFRQQDTTGLGDIDPNEVNITIPGNLSRFHACSDDDLTCMWDGYTAEGAIAISTIHREQGCSVPQISQVTQAIYTRYHAIDGLRYVFVRTVVNEETFAFVQRQLYTEAHGLQWPNWGPQAWDIGTPQYDALLGTRIGKVVAYLVLGAFDRGTRRIKQIYTWPSMSGYAVNFRFGIEIIG